MNLEHYEYNMNVTDAYVQYEFFSQGPKGIIKKFVRFDKFDDDFYNLSFGDSIAGTEDFLDEITSNNGDTERVLTTVAEVIMEFSLENPNFMIHAEGSTPARSRLYRICLNKHRMIINKHFYIYGQLMNGAWEKFKKNGSYIAFAGTRKNP
jgi:hypothetical protein